MLLIAAGLVWSWPHMKAAMQAQRDAREARPAFVGSAVCAGCHEPQHAAWRGSQHALAMQVAGPRSMLGDSDGAEFRYAGVTSTFLQRDGKYYARSDGADGNLADFELRYAFGLYPLQQYLVPFPDGRLQALSIAWDARPQSAGGQRWFHLYPGERVAHGDELHWTGPAQNWNHMCADCHSTGLRKNYEEAAGRFDTRWSEISVGCEACHGPGERHVSWAKAGHSREDDPAMGLTAQLDERRGVRWMPDAASGNSRRSVPRATDRELQVCAQCHARRAQIADGYIAGEAFLDHYLPVLLERPFYYDDGQQRDEVYSWGSFLQSRMHAQGVTCSDCHEPHGGKLRAEGNAVCAQCHAPAKFDAAAHHHHDPGTAGAQCAACHMPVTTYMGVDPRHDHSLRVPRPDLSVTLGTPSACNGCHSQRDARWAAAQLRAWLGRDARGYQQFAEAFHAAQAGAANATAQLLALAAERAQPGIVRASALARLPEITPAARAALGSAIGDADPLLRLGALQALAGADADTRGALAAPLLDDPLRGLRLLAASLVADVPGDRLGPGRSAAFERAAAEYVAAQRYNADRADARVNLGSFLASRGDAAGAERELAAAIRLDPHYFPAYVNLADLYRATGRDAEAERVLREGLMTAPENAPLHHALGLTLVRLQRQPEALAELERAVRLAPADARFQYVYAVALHSSGREEAAIARLEQALAAHPNDRDILEALAGFHQQRGEIAQARKYAERLRALSPSGEES